MRRTSRRTARRTSRRMNRRADRRREGEQGASADQAGGGQDTTAQLEQLAKLHQSGALSDEEFAAAKAKLLG